MGGFNNSDMNLTNKQKHLYHLATLYSTSSLQVSLGEDLAAALADGVVLCHIANHVSPRAVSSIHVPSPAVVSLSSSQYSQSVILSSSAQADRSQVQEERGQLPLRLQEDRRERGE